MLGTAGTEGRMSAYWADRPVQQWIYLKKELYHRAPYCVMVGDFVRARFVEEQEAEALVAALTTVFQQGTA
jgi:hypothetical protein